MRHPHVPTAREIMVRKLVTLRPDMPVSEATASVQLEGLVP